MDDKDINKSPDQRAGGRVRINDAVIDEVAGGADTINDPNITNIPNIPNAPIPELNESLIHPLTGGGGRNGKREGGD